MQVSQTLNEGLKREFRVVLPVSKLADRVSARLEELRSRAQIPGFRPGKVPVTHLRRLYGKSVMAEELEKAVGEANAEIVKDQGVKLATEPKVTFPENAEEVQGVIEGKADLAYTLALELLPRFELGDFRGLTLEKPVLEPSTEEIADALATIAKNNAPYTDRAEGGAENGDRLDISFVGRIDGEAFEGGTGENISLELGSKSFIPGFEDQLLGVKAGETRAVSVTFPEAYQAAHLQGKDAAFDVTVNKVEVPQPVEIDDALAVSIGMENREKLEEAVKAQIAKGHADASRRKVKRQLLDQLDGLHRFDLPPSLVDQEFENVWRSVTQELTQAGKSFADEGEDEEKAKAEYRGIAERRVRLGLVLAEIGEKNNIQVTEQEVTRAVVERARMFPGQEKMVWEFYQKNPEQLAGLRAPIFEEKVVDYILELATVTEKPVTKDELYAEEAEEAA